MRLKMNSGDLQDAISAIQITANDEALMMLEDDRWMIKSADEASVLMAAILMPRGAMKEYERNGYERVGLPINKIDKFISGRTDTVTIWMEERALHIDDGSTHVKLATIDPDAVEGHMSGAPTVEHEVMFEGSLDTIKDFVNRADDVLTTGYYLISTREQGLFLYAEGDNGQMTEFISWSDFDNYEIDWSINNEGPNGSIVPEAQKGTDAIMSIEWSQQLVSISDEAKIYVGNHIPIRILFDKSEDRDAGMKVSLIQTPRIDQSGRNTMPQEVIDHYL